MKHTTKHMLSLSFCALLAVSLLASCGGDGGTAVDTAQTGTADTTLPAETETTRYMPELPEADYDGYTFRVAHWEHPGWESRACKDIYAEAENGDTINDAV